MRYVLFMAFLVGCGSAAPIDTKTNWSVTLGNSAVPVCDGDMLLVPNGEKFFGAWACGSYSGEAHAEFVTDGRVFLDLETTPGFFNHVRGRFTSDDVIEGGILLDGVSVQFAAFRQ